MKIVVTSDWHLDASTAGIARFAELEASVDETVRTAIEQKADIYLFLGDLCDPDSGSRVFRCVELAMRTALRLKAAGIPSLWMAGNHDVLEDGSGETTLSPLRSLEDPQVLSTIEHGGFEVRQIERPTTLHPSASIDVIERPTLLRFDDAYEFGRSMAAYFAMLPFCASSHAYDPVAAARMMIDEVEESPLVACGHLSISGIVPGEEKGELARGRDVEFPAREIEEARAVTKEHTLLLHGHYHRQQSFMAKGARLPIHIPGSLARLTFGEHGEPGFLVIDIARRQAGV